ncbi:hypothetical protein, partial [Xanthomonas phaseoli]|uniref:hypothetical protein n=2 Tax=Xanthomonas phaseoli TaxID=1985254 RepID=UPI001ADA66C2
QHGARRYHASNEIGDGRLAPLLANAQSGGITLGTPLQNADTAVQVFSKSSHAAVETLSFQNVVWLECYVSALLHHHPIDAKNAADAHLRGVLRHNIRSSGEISH